MKYIYLLLAFMAVNTAPYAQNKDIINDPGQLKQYLNQSAFAIDSTAQAIVLYERGTVQATYYTIERTIKILGKKAFKEATVVIPMDENSLVRDLEAITYNMDGGIMSSQAVEKSEIIKEKVSSNTYVTKFNLPSVREGSIIHYSYMVERPFTPLIPDWRLQGEFPKLYSEYDITLPPYVIFTSIEHSNKTSKTVTKRSELQDCDACFFTQGLAEKGTNNIWVRRNIPAYTEEPFMLAKENYTDRIRVHVTATVYGDRKNPILKSWEQLNEDVFYKNDKLCGQVFSRNSFLDGGVAEITSGASTDMDKAKAIFRFVRDSIKEKGRNSWNGLDIENIFDKREGSKLGINLLLTAMLRKAGMNSEPVLVATKAEECLHPLFADPRNINYLVSSLKIDGKTCFLDASEKYIPFDLLPVSCYNGLAMAVNKKGNFVYLSPDSLKDRSFTLVTITPSEKAPGKLNIKATYSMGRISGYGLRARWHNDTALALDQIEKNWTVGHDLTITGRSIQHLPDPDSTLKIIVEAEIDINNNDLVYCDLYFDKFFQQNPFPASKRMFPITMDYRRDATYVLALQLPPGYIIEDYPRSTIVKLDETGIMELQNIARYDKEKNQLRIQNHFVANTATFPLEVYNQLREFYDHVIDEQNKKVVIKKIN